MRIIIEVWLQETDADPRENVLYVSAINARKGHIDYIVRSITTWLRSSMKETDKDGEIILRDTA